MIETRASVFSGSMQGLRIEEVRGRIIESMDFYLRGLRDKVDKNWDYRNIRFKFELTQQEEKHLKLNAKNTEYQEFFHYNDGVPTSVESRKKLKLYGFTDIIFDLLIYRLGSYSYYTCDVTLVPEFDENAGCFCGQPVD